MSDARFCLHASTVYEGGVTGFALVRARAGHVVDCPESPTASILTNPMRGLEDAPGSRESGMLSQVCKSIDRAGSLDSGSHPGSCGRWIRLVAIRHIAVCSVGGEYGALRGAFYSTSVAPISYVDVGSVDPWGGPWLHGCHVHPTTVPSRFFESSGRQIFPAYLAPKSTRSAPTRDLRLESSRTISMLANQQN